MTTKPIDDGGPAFPTRNNITSDDPSEFLPQPGSWHGMYLRDWFAGMALSEWVKAHIEQTVDDLDKPSIACECYSYADAMLAARKGGSNE